MTKRFFQKDESAVELIGLVCVFGLTLLIGFWLYRQVFLPLGSIGWDEGAHLLDAYQVTLPLRQGNLMTALREGYNEFLYPPGYSFIIGFWSFLAGIGVAEFRLWSLLSYGLSAIFLFLAGWNLAKKIKGFKSIPKVSLIVGVATAVLFLSAPLFWIFSAQALLEPTGTLVSVICLWLIVRSDLSRWSSWLVIGLAVVGLEMVKYNYGLILMTAVAADAVVAFWLQGPGWLRKNIQGMVAFAVPIGLYFLFWVALPGRIIGFIQYVGLVGQSYSYGVMSFWEHIFWFLPASLLYDYLPSPLLGVLYLSGLVFVSRHIGIREVRVLFLAFFINFVLETIALGNQQQRYLATTVPYLFLLGIVGLVEMVRAGLPVFRRSGLTFRIIGVIGVIGVIVFVGRDFLWNVGNVRGIGEHLLGSPVYSSKDFQMTQFSFNRDRWSKGPQLAQQPEDILKWIVDQSGYRRPLNYNGRLNEVSPPVTEFLRTIRRDGWVTGAKDGTLNYPQYALTITVAPGSILDTYDFQVQNKNADEQGLAAVTADTRWVKAAEKEFMDLGATVTLWGWQE